MKKFLILASLLFILLLAYIVYMHNGNPKASNPEALCIGLILPGSKETDGWSASHYNALKSLSEEMNFQLIVKENVSEFDDSAISAIEELAKENAKIICLAGMNFGAKITRVLDKYPKIYFQHVSGLDHMKNLSSFFGKIYQARYLTGIVAGRQSKNNRIGFVAAMPVTEVIRGINAFTLGVRSVNPNATVYVKYSGRWNLVEKEKEAAEYLIDKDAVDVITYHQNSFTAAKVADDRGVFSITYHIKNDGSLSDRSLTGAVWNWAPFYRERIEDTLFNRMQSRNYWGGLEKNVVDIAPLSNEVEEGTEQLVEAARNRIKEGNWDVFHGPIRDNHGEVRVEAGSAMSDQQLINNFNWYVEGVVVEE